MLQRGLNNTNFDAATNGEARALRILSRHDMRCLFDVGANVGDWSRMASESFPESSIHAFEVVPATFAELVRKTSDIPGITHNGVGLSDSAEEITLYLSSKGTSDATAFKINSAASHNDYYVHEVRGRTITGLDYVTTRNIPEVDILKIDVEGMDLRVIRGFSEALDRVRVIQFEYGVFNISSHDLLSDFYALLEEAGFVIGKIYPRVVDFSAYHFHMENFHYSNYLAIRRGESELLAELATYTR